MLAFKVLLMVCHFVGDICKVIDCTHLFCITFKNIVVDFFLCNLMEQVVVDAEKIGAEQQAPLLLDAPVSGGVVGAQAATLTFMVKKP